APELALEHSLLRLRARNELLRRHPAAEILLRPDGDVRAHDLILAIGAIACSRYRAEGVIAAAALNPCNGIRGAAEIAKRRHAATRRTAHEGLHRLISRRLRLNVLIELR